MDLKEKLISSYTEFEQQVDSDQTIKNLRKKAIANFATKGFPTKKEEAWKYTSLKPVLKENYTLFPHTTSKLTQEDIDFYFVNNLDTYNLVFIDGKFSAELSKTNNEKFKVLELSEARKDDSLKTIIDKHYNKVALQDDSLNSLNTAFNQEGTFIYISKSVVGDKPVQIFNFSTGSEEATLLQPRHLVVAEENSQVRIIERHQSLTDNPTLTNSVTEIYLHKNAIVDYYKIQNDKHSSSLIDNTYAIQESNSDYTCHTFSFGGKLTRNNSKVFQKGEHINSTLKGITILEDKQHVDHNTFINHQQPNCESHQDYKGVYDDKSVGVFDGYILVDKIAQKTDGFQSSNNLLLSDSAKINAKPQLEIYADDVKCSHGCTVGQLDKEALFYLKSRGIPEKESRALMMYAFCNNVLNSVNIPELKQRVNKLIANKLGVNLGFDE